MLFYNISGSRHLNLRPQQTSQVLQTSGQQSHRLLQQQISARLLRLHLLHFLQEAHHSEAAEAAEEAHHHQVEAVEAHQ